MNAVGRFGVPVVPEFCRPRSRTLEDSKFTGRLVVWLHGWGKIVFPSSSSGEMMSFEMMGALCKLHSDEGGDLCTRTRDLMGYTCVVLVRSGAGREGHHSAQASAKGSIGGLCLGSAAGGNVHSSATVKYCT